MNLGDKTPTQYDFMSKVSPCRFGAKSSLKMDSPSSQKGASFLESLLFIPASVAFLHFLIHLVSRLREGGLWAQRPSWQGLALHGLRSYLARFLRGGCVLWTQMSFHQTLDVVDVQILHQIIQTDLWDKKKWRGDGLKGKFEFRIQVTWCDRYSCFGGK